MLAGIITEGQYKVKLNEVYEFRGRPDVFLYAKQYFKEDPSRRKNQDFEKHKSEIIQSIKDDWDDFDLSSEAMKIIDKEIKNSYEYSEKYKNDPYIIGKEKEDEINKERYRNNLLPLKYTGSIRDKPNPKYYSDSTNFYSYTDSYGNSRTKAASGEGRNYTLDSKYRDTPVDKATLDQHWNENLLKGLGLKK
jgi:hypothetical protein